MICLGLDLSLRAPGAWITNSTGNGGAPNVTMRRPKDNRPGYSHWLLSAWISSVVAGETGHSVDLAVIEEVFVHPKMSPRTALALAEVHGIVKAELARRGIYFLVVPAMVARRAVLGHSPKGPDVKGQIAALLKAQGLVFRDDNEADAYVLARYGMNLLKTIGLDGIKREQEKLPPPKRKQKGTK